MFRLKLINVVLICFIYQTMLEEDDENGDGKISFDEFKKGVGEYIMS